MLYSEFYYLSTAVLCTTPFLFCHFDCFLLNNDSFNDYMGGMLVHIQKLCCPFFRWGGGEGGWLVDILKNLCVFSD